MSRTACLVVAAGAGTRLGAGAPKAFVDVAGQRVIDLAVAAVLGSGVIDLVIAVVPADRLAQVSAEMPHGVVAVPGGRTRGDSVRAGLTALPTDVDVVLIHDAARCLTPPQLVTDVLAAVRAGHDVVVPGVAVSDTMRRIDAGDVPGRVVDRTTLRAVQTPQGFRRTVIDEAHASPDEAATDDATLAEACGHTVHVIPGSELAFKVTRPLDLQVAAALVRSASAVTPSGE